MPTIEIEGFNGIIPRTGDARLPAMNAQTALNVKLQSGELRPWRNPVSVFSPKTPNVQGIYKHIGPNNATQWLEFPCDVDVVSSPQADISDFRLYYTGATIEPRKTNWALATGSSVDGNLPGPCPLAYYEMGVPGPTAAPAVASSNTSSPAIYYTYVYTYVTLFGSITEESAPSPASALVEVYGASGTVTINGFQAPPSGRYNYQFINIYRSVSGATTAGFQLVAQIPISQTTYVDSQAITQLGQDLSSTYYTPPPTGLTGLVEMPNGMLAGFVGNQVWFCQPYYPHAWPVIYMQTVEFPIVGLGVFGNTLFVGTTKNPFLITGTSPAAMTMEELPIIQSCVSKRSIVSDQWGVVYASPNGLLAVGPGVQDIVTQELYTRDEWQPLNPTSLIGILYNNMYIGFYNNGLGPTTAFVFTRNDVPPLSDYNFDATCVFVERTTSNIYAVSQSTNQIYQLDADPNNNTIYQWMSKEYIMPEPTSFAALKVMADFSYIFDPIAYAAVVAADEAANQALWDQYVLADPPQTLGGCLNDVQMNWYQVNGSILQSIPPIESTRNIQIIVFADGVQVFQTPVTNNNPIRMPGGFKGYTWEFMITGNAPVQKFAIATSMGELRRI